MLPGGPLKRRAAVHFAVSLPGDTGVLFRGSGLAPAFYIVFNLIMRLKEGSAAYRSANNVIFIFEEFPISDLDFVVGKSLDQELHNE